MAHKTASEPTVGPEGNSGYYKLNQSSLNRERIIIIVLAAMIVVSVIISLTLGRYSMSPGEVVNVIVSKLRGEPIPSKQQEVVVLLIRLPRILLTLIIGAGLAASGAAFQGLFNNPMCSPDILGVTTGASVGASLVILLGYDNVVMIQVVAFISGIGAVLLVVGLSSAVSRGRSALIYLILAGSVVGSLGNAINTLIKFLAGSDSDRLSEIVYWLMGSFSSAGTYQNLLINGVVFLIAGLPLLLIRHKLNALAFGEEEALALGVNVKRIRYLVIFCSTMLTATAVATCGMIGWVGVTIPHIVRLMVGPNFRSLMPISMLSGGLFLLVVDDICRTVTSAELPVGVVTALVGAPIFLYMMYNGQKGWL